MQDFRNKLKFSWNSKIDHKIIEDEYEKMKIMINRSLNIEKKDKTKILKSLENQKKILKMYNMEIEYTDFLFDKFFTKTLGPIFPEIDFEIPENMKQKQGYYSKQYTNLIENDKSGGKTVYSKSVVNNDGEIKNQFQKKKIDKDGKEKNVEFTKEDLQKFGQSSSRRLLS
jgi:hypothetical protein